MVRYALSVLLLAAALAGCGTEGDGASGTTAPRATPSGSSTPFSARDVEEGLAADLAEGGGIVELGDEPPKLISCEKSEAETEWSCRVTPSKSGEDVVCMVTVDPTTRVVSKRDCARLDY
ncbi:MAG: hypothetical protein H0V79_04600 [Actinobacteria bacterium]|nr:hypothetical protein [Actinomycetota bacterium]